MQQKCAYRLSIIFIKVRVDNSPKLWLFPSNSVDPDIFRIPQCQADGSSILIAVPTVLVIPFLSVTEEECLTMSLQREILSAQSPGGRPSSICDANAVSQPVLDVIVPS